MRRSSVQVGFLAPVLMGGDTRPLEPQLEGAAHIGMARAKHSSRRTRRRRGLFARWRALPGAARAALAIGLLGVLALGYQLVRKPTELLAVVPTAPKVPPSTWAAYGPLFRQYSTDLVRPELLAALVQVETAGDPLARTYWRWRWSWNPLDLYGPASSAVGLLQITDDTFADAQNLCVHRHRVAREGPIRGPRPCSPDDTHVRWLPGDAIEMTAAWLDQSVRETLGGRLGRATPEQRRRLAAVIHLCGRGRGAGFARRGFRALPGERCGDHRLAEYLARVDHLADEFGRLAACERGAGSLASTRG